MSGWVYGGGQPTFSGRAFFFFFPFLFLVLSGALMASDIGRMLAGAAAHLRTCEVVLNLACQDWSCM